jgi:aryl-alcohol dehydrogenase-like predicted oxidoreductase
MQLEQKIGKRQLGGSNLWVTPIGLGVMQFSGASGVFRFVFSDIEQAKMDAIVAAALGGGINWFDTAEIYGGGRSERGLAAGLSAAGASDEQAIVATKWFPILRWASNIGRTIGARLRNLAPYTIDLHYVHQPWGLSSREGEMEAMAELVAAGKIRNVGVSNFNPAQMRRAAAALERRGLKLAANQVQYSLLHRAIERNGVLETARELGVSIVAWGPLASGLLSGCYHRDPAALARVPAPRRMRLRRMLESSQPLISTLERIGQDYDATAAQVALNWLIHSQGETVVAIPGASRVSQAQEAAQAMAFHLKGAEIEELSRISDGITR